MVRMTCALSSFVLTVCMPMFGCKSLEKAILNSKAGGTAFAKASYSIEKYYRNEFSIRAAEGFRIEETPRGERVVLLVHGFGSGGGIWGDPGDQYSTLSLAREIFAGRVLVANYPSQENIDRISSELTLEMERIRFSCGGVLPDIVALAHSMGGVVTRAMARGHPDYFREIALVGVPNTGLHLGILTGFVFHNYAEYLDDLYPSSEFIESLNTPTEPMDVTYHFFVLKRTETNNIFIPGRDDSLVSPGSAGGGNARA